MRENPKENGFIAIISLFLVMAIIAVLAVLYFQESKNGQGSTTQTGKDAIEQAKKSNQTQLEQEKEIQNQINGMGN